MTIEAILFDLGKVLIDLHFDSMMRTMTAACSKPASVFESVIRDDALARRYESGLMSTEQFHQHLCELGGLQLDLTRFREAWCSMFEPELLVSEDLLKALKRRYPLILISNTNEAHVEYISRNYSVLDYFDHRVLSYEVGFMKPDRRIYECAIALSGVRPSALFFTDDREENIFGAAQLGIQTHRFRGEPDLVAALRDAGVELGDVAHREPFPDRTSMRDLH